MVQVIAAYKRRLKARGARTERRLQVFEDRYGAWTPHLLEQMTAAGLDNGDLEQPSGQGSQTA